MNAVLKPVAPAGPMSAINAVEARFEPLSMQLLDALMAVELQAYSHPWQRAHFVDAIHAGHQAQVLMAGEAVLAYFVAMRGVEEVHLLNITVAPAQQGQGWARVCLDALSIWARGQAAKWVWLEVRSSNTRAIQVYQAQGYKRVGLRKAYYPNGEAPREDAVVMSLAL